MNSKGLLTLVLLMAFFVLPVHAQETAEEDQMVTYGTVVSVSAQQIVILEYDFDTDADIEVTYTIDANTKLEAMATIDELQVDDPVEIVYVEKEGMKIAQSIKKEDFSLEETEEDMGEVGAEIPEAGMGAPDILNVENLLPEDVNQVIE